MDEPENGDGQRKPFESVSTRQALKSKISAAIAAEPGFETSAVRISVSAGFVVLEGYVAEAEQIGRVVEIARMLSKSDRVKCFLFCWS